MIKTTKTLKLSLCLVLILALALLAPVCAFADEGLTDAEITDSPAEDTAETQDAKSTGDTDAQAPEEGDTETADEGFFGALFAEIEDRLAQILSALAFLGSLIIMICYKRGFLPLVKDGIGALASGVRSISEKTGELNLEATEITNKISAGLEDAQKLLLSMEGAVCTVNARLDALEDERDERKKLTAVLSAEVDMLYEIFMSAALPQYLKDSVGERIAKMKAEISETAHDEQN